MISSINNNYKPNFEGLNRIMKTRPLYNNPEFFEKLTDVFQRENGSVGSFPKDILELLKNASKGSIAEKIEETKEILNNTNKILSEIEMEKIKIATNINPKNLVTQFLPKLAKIEIQPERIPKIFNEMRKRLTPDIDSLSEFTTKASEYMEKEFKQMGVLKPDEKINITYVQQGKFKNAFKLEFLNSKGENIIHPKSLLNFKDKQIAHTQYEKLIDIIKKYYFQTSEKQYLNIIDNLLKNASRKVVPSDMIEKYQNVLSEMFYDIKYGNGEEKFRNIINKTIVKEIKYNGIGAESNITQFVKHSAGSPLIHSNFIPFYYLNLKHNVALAEFSDSFLGKPQHKIKLSKYGLFHDDIDMNKDNIVLDRIVDYGNIKPLQDIKRISESSVIRRYFHKFLQIECKDKNKTISERIKYWNNLYTKAINHKIPNHNEILEALRLCKRELPIDYHYKLLDSGSDAFI